MSYAEVNGLSLYYEEHGSGEPLILLHGGISAGEMFAPILPDLAARRRVITVDLQGHGHTADVEPPVASSEHGRRRRRAHRAPRARERRRDGLLARWLRGAPHGDPAPAAGAPPGAGGDRVPARRIASRGRGGHGPDDSGDRRDAQAVSALRGVLPPRPAGGGLARADRQDERDAQGGLRLDAARSRSCRCPSCSSTPTPIPCAPSTSSSSTGFSAAACATPAGTARHGPRHGWRSCRDHALRHRRRHPHWCPRWCPSSTRSRREPRQPSVSGSTATTTVPRPGGLTTRQRPARRLGAVAQAEDAGAARRVGAAAAVVGDLAAQDAAVAADGDRARGRPPRAWRRWSAPRRRCSTPSPRRARAAARSARRARRRSAGARRAPPARAAGPCSPRIAGCRPRAISRSSCQPGVELARARRRAGRAVASGWAASRARASAQLERDRDEALLRAVVEVALQPAALLVAGLDEARARGDQVRARLGAGDRQRHELAERAEPVLGLRRQRVLAGDRDRAPQRAGDDDRRGRGRAVAGAEDRLGDLARAGRPSRRSARARPCRARARAPSASLGRQALADAEARRCCRGCGGRRSSPCRRPRSAGRPTR